MSVEHCKSLFDRILVHLESPALAPRGDGLLQSDEAMRLS
jgi:hypothetical protein